MTSATQKICPGCDTVFICGSAPVDEACWCEGLPRVTLVADRSLDCFCPRCLEEAIANLNRAESESSSIKDKQNSLSELREGEDYYVDGAAIVFMERYHLRRGYCCESGCRHCPYRIEMTKEA